MNSITGNNTGPSTNLSVVVTIGTRRWRAVRCLKALLAQESPPEMEIIVMDHKPGLPLAGLEDRSPFRFVSAAECVSIPAAKALGASHANYEVVAFLEDHCVPEPGWAAAVSRAFTNNPDIAACAYSFHNLNPVNWCSRSFLVMAYGPWMAPAASGPIPTPSWMNTAFRRHILEAETNLPREFSCEVLFQNKLRAAGAKFWQAGDAHVRHLNHPDLLGSCFDSGVWQRLLAGTKVEMGGWGWPRRIFYALAAIPLSPGIITYRLSRRLWQRPEMRGHLLSSLPLVFFVYTFGAFFEAMGYIAGPGDPRDTFRIETEDPRGEAP
jgi:hypothetical protein